MREKKQIVNEINEVLQRVLQREVALISGVVDPKSSFTGFEQLESRLKDALFEQCDPLSDSEILGLEAHLSDENSPDTLGILYLLLSNELEQKLGKETTHSRKTQFAAEIFEHAFPTIAQLISIENVDPTANQIKSAEEKLKQKLRAIYKKSHANELNTLHDMVGGVRIDKWINSIFNQPFLKKLAQTNADAYLIRLDRLGSILYQLEYKPELIDKYIHQIVVQEELNELLSFIYYLNAEDETYNHRDEEKLLIDNNIHMLLTESFYVNKSTVLHSLEILKHLGVSFRDLVGITNRTDNKTSLKDVLNLVPIFAVLIKAGFDPRVDDGIFKRVATTIPQRMIVKTIQKRAIGLLFKAFCQLQKAGFNTGHVAIFNDILKDVVNAYHEYLLRAVDALFQNKMLTKENFEIVKDHKNIPSAVLTLERLSGADLLDQNNFHSNRNSINDKFYLKRVESLYNAQLLTKDNFNAIKYCENPRKIDKAVYFLCCNGFLKQDNLSAIIKSDDPYDIAQALNCLREGGILTPENRDAVQKDKDPLSFANALVYLHAADILTPENRDAVQKDKYPSSFAEALVYLHEADILTPENRDVARNRQFPKNLAGALVCLHKADILTPEYRGEVKNHKDPFCFAEALVCLHKADILTPKNHDAIKDCYQLYYVAQALKILDQNKILEQDDFDIIKDHRWPPSAVLTLMDVQKINSIGLKKVEKGILFSLIDAHEKPREFVATLKEIIAENMSSTNVALFNQKNHPDPLVECLKRQYIKNDNQVSTPGAFFSTCKNFSDAVTILEEMQNACPTAEREKSAAYQTLKEFGGLEKLKHILGLSHAQSSTSLK